MIGSVRKVEAPGGLAPCEQHDQKQPPYARHGKEAVTGRGSRSRDVPYANYHGPLNSVVVRPLAWHGKYRDDSFWSLK